MIKTKRGITIIALIITIVVLIILAGVTINMVMGENGLINKAKIAVGKYENEQEREKTSLDDYENKIKGYISGNRDYETEIAELRAKIEQLEGKIDSIENSQNTVDVTSALALNSTYVTSRSTCKMYKTGNVVTLTLYLNVINDIPANTQFITFSNYKPKTGYIQEGFYTNAIKVYNLGVNGISCGGTLAGGTTSDPKIICINAIWTI